jgi:hypothetical protein
MHVSRLFSKLYRQYVNKFSVFLDIETSWCDVSGLPFVFIDILALFREFWSAAAKLPPLNRNLASLIESQETRRQFGNPRCRSNPRVFQRDPLFS